MTVWTVWDDTSDDHPSLLDIYATEKAAQEALIEYMKNDVLGSVYSIMEWTVNDGNNSQGQSQAD